VASAAHSSTRHFNRDHQEYCNNGASLVRRRRVAESRRDQLHALPDEARRHLSQEMTGIHAHPTPFLGATTAQL